MAQSRSPLEEFRATGRIALAHRCHVEIVERTDYDFDVYLVDEKGNRQIVRQKRDLREARRLAYDFKRRGVRPVWLRYRHLLAALIGDYEP